MLAVFEQITNHITKSNFHFKNDSARTMETEVYYHTKRHASRPNMSNKHHQ